MEDKIRDMDEKMEFVLRNVPSNLGREILKTWQTLKAAVLAQQTTNNARDALCPHAKIMHTVCKCEKSGIEAHGKKCDGKGIYTYIGNMCYEYQYPCGGA